MSVIHLFHEGGLLIRNACNKKNSSYFVSRRLGVGGSNIEVVSKSQNMSFFVGHFMKKSENKKALFLGFGDIRVGWGERHFQLSSGDKI